MTARLRAVVALLAVALLVAACGIPQDGEPRVIAEEPDGFSTTSQPAENDPGEARSVQVYLLVDSGTDPRRLIARERTIEQTPGPLEAVNRLLAGTTEDEDTEGLLTAIPPGTQLLLEDSRVEGEVAVLDLSNEIEGIAADTAVQAYAQLVYTVTQYDAALSVQFRTEGENVNVPTDEGNLPEVNRSDYGTLRPES
jgi:spore germination protein GerM